jgi:hypothetical protein
VSAGASRKHATRRRLDSAHIAARVSKLERRHSVIRHAAIRSATHFAENCGDRRCARTSMRAK